MSDPLLPADDGHTPLSDEEREGLIPSYITLRAELNAAEQAKAHGSGHDSAGVHRSAAGRRWP